MMHPDKSFSIAPADLKRKAAEADALADNLKSFDLMETHAEVYEAARALEYAAFVLEHELLDRAEEREG